MFTATLRLRQHKDCVLRRLTERAREPVRVDIEEFHDESVTFILRAGDRADEFNEELERTDHVEFVERLDEDNLLVTKPSCGAYSAIYQNHGVLRRLNTVHGRRRRYQVLVFRREDLKRVVDGMRDIGRVKLGQLKELGDSGSHLTQRQRQVVTRALELGYYEWPREIDGEELAAELGISRATLHEHLRKAERKLLSTGLSEGPIEGRRQPP